MRLLPQTGVGFIGCGGHACGSNIPHAAANPKLKIIAFCDLNQQRLDELNETYNPCFVTSDMEKIFAAEDIHMVVCATKPDYRMPIMELALKYKKPLFVEKPMAYTLEDTLKMMDLMKDSGVPFIVGFNRPYSPMMQAAKQIYKRHRHGNTTIIYRIVGESAIWPPEHRRNVIDGKESTVVHEATHIFDLLNWLTESEPYKINMAGGGNIDNIITLSYPSDVNAVIIAGDNGSVGYPKERIEINTDCGTIAGEFFVELDVVGMGKDSGQKFFEYLYKGKKYIDGISGIKKILFDWRNGLKEEEINVGRFFGKFPEVDKGHYGQQEYFRNCIVSGTPVETNARRGAIPSLIAWKAMESWEKGESIDLDFSELN